MSALSHAPAPLRLKSAGLQASHMPAELGGAGFRQATFAEVRDFFDNPNASRANASNAFLVMQANLYVTQVSNDHLSDPGFGAFLPDPSRSFFTSLTLGQNKSN